MRTAPRVSVVIPVYNAESTIADLLRALGEQELDTEKFEIILVDDGSVDKSNDLVGAWLRSTSIEAKHLRQPNGGPGAARNLGIAHARGKLIAFTDADCVPDKGWLTSVLSGATDGAAIMAGDTYCNDTLVFPWKVAPAGQVGVTANLAIDTSRTGPIEFNKDFQKLGEDTDLILRLEDGGHRMVYLSEMKVCHPPHTYHFKQFYQKALSRQYEVLLYKHYRKRISSSISPVFRPIIFNRLSIYSLAITLIFTATLFGIYRGNSGIILVALGLMLGSFIAFGYRYLITYGPRRLSLMARVKTAAYLVAYGPIFIYARLLGSWKYKFLMV